ncbi:MAG: iron uptake porin [Cyanobacteriota bacterium]|jgi:hypothetical protein
MLRLSLFFLIFLGFVPSLYAQETAPKTLREIRQQRGTLSFSADPLAQVNAVEQLRDVQTTDWAYEALQSLVARYGCIAGYPDGTFRGNRALSRWEFAAGLNACLNTVEKLLAENGAVLREDLDILKRLAQNFATELGALGGKVDNLEHRLAYLEDHSFSTTTKLMGSAIFSVADVFGKSNSRNQTVLQYRTNLNFVTSFTGQDALITSLFAGNAPLRTSFNLPGVETPTAFGINVSPETAEGTLSSQFAANTNNSLQMLALQYIFPLSEKLLVNVTSSSSAYQPFIPTQNPLLDDASGGRGSLSEFGQRNPIYSLGGGGTGVMINYQVFDSLKLSAGYLASGLEAGNPRQGQGLFNGGYGALGQLTWQPIKEFSLAAVYLNDYSPPGRFGFNYNGLGVAGTAVANSLAGQDILFGDRLGIDQYPVISNAYGLNFAWQPSADIALSGWFSATNARLIGQGDGDILSYAITLGFANVAKEGDLLGFVVGAQPYLTGFNGGNPQPFKVDVPLHLEGFYRYALNNNISITPGFIWLLAPNQDRGNSSDVIGVIRTTFVF